MENLLNSPIYNLSMCSLENFHTCFLNWLGNKYPQETLKLFSNKQVLNPNNIKFETQVQYGIDIKLDLQITIKDGNETEFIIIENKLKSYPTVEQLKKYEQAFKEKEATFILLSLAPITEIPDSWQYYSYHKLEENLKKQFKELKDYDKYLVDDYINVIRNINSAFPTSSTQMFDFYDCTSLDKLGLKDIYIKFKTSELTNIIKKRIKSKDIYIGHSFHNKKGTIDIVKSILNNKFHIGIQIEKDQYRYFARFGNNEDCSTREEITEELFSQNCWFFNTDISTRGKIYKTFLGYKPDFIYRYITLSDLFGKQLENISFNEIAQKVEQDICRLEENETKIIRIIANYL